MKRHISRQGETWGVFLVALIGVLLYALWGSIVLGNHGQASAAPTGTTVVVNR